MALNSSAISLSTQLPPWAHRLAASGVLHVMDKDMLETNTHPMLSDDHMVSEGLQLEAWDVGLLSLKPTLNPESSHWLLRVPLHQLEPRIIFRLQVLQCYCNLLAIISQIPRILGTRSVEASRRRLTVRRNEGFMCKP